MKAAAIGGYQLKVTLKSEGGQLMLDGADRDDDGWRPREHYVSDQVVEAFKKKMDALEPMETELQLRLKRLMGS